MNIKKEILKECKKLNLSLDIKHTSITYYLLSKSYSPMVYISLACKSNDLNIELHSDDNALAQDLNYDFNNQSILLLSYGVLLRLMERKIDLNYEECWFKLKENLLKLLVYYEISDGMSFVVAAFGLEESLFDFIGFDRKRVSELKSYL
ncbi:hypothetical protein TUBRATIS_28160 [Tubulinosema ratisbonensis]|uniref:Uncharacterized protein n=1 Tax=Tubulinosema ratisbonensis TaxID=291195 RepID=A0A437AI69_9MICR|nr:hypothetical protein TUBRATIS_28160 [Tubulinosema ratisbonensis]